jgi:DNA-binding NarL/FixJ family response regulator
MRIMLVDDHKPTRDEVRGLISIEPDMTVVAEADTGEDAVRLAREHRPDAIVMDIMMPGMNGIETTRRILTEQPDIKVLALSNHSGRSLVLAILNIGGLGYVPKNRAFEELIPALRCVADGQQYIRPDGTAGK